MKKLFNVIIFVFVIVTLVSAFGCANATTMYTIEAPHKVERQDKKDGDLGTIAWLTEANDSDYKHTKSWVKDYVKSKTGIEADKVAVLCHHIDVLHDDDVNITFYYRTNGEWFEFEIPHDQTDYRVSLEIMRKDLYPSENCIYLVWNHSIIEEYESLANDLHVRNPEREQRLIEILQEKGIKANVVSQEDSFSINYQSIKGNLWIKLYISPEEV